jgi:hypothetical protein
VYEPDGAGGWTETKLVASDAEVGDHFGYSVDVSGDRIVIGAYGDSDRGGNSGAAYVFDRDGVGGWNETKLLAADGAGGDAFGSAVAVWGDRILIGSPGDSRSRGSAYLFELDGTWGETKLTASDLAASHLYAAAVDVYDDRLVIGAPGVDGGRSLRDVGAVFVYEPDGLGGWAETKLTAAQPTRAGNMGLSVAAYGDRVAAGTENGSVHLFTLAGGSWVETVIESPEGEVPDLFGTAVAIDGNRLVVGAYADDEVGRDVGAAYVFDLAPAEPEFIRADGTGLTLEDEPFAFTGLNIYNANSDGTCGSAVDLDQAIVDIGPGKTVIRSWFFQDLATTNGVRDWSRFDATLTTAAEHGVMVIPVLANQWADCDQGYGFKTKAWYQSGYQTQVDPAGTVSYRDWVAEVTARYSNNPTVAFWQLINEAEIQDVEGGDCSLVADAALTLATWADDISGLIKSIDPNHLVSLGTIGGGQCGTQGQEYQDVHAVPGIDLCEYHDYGSPAVPLPGDEFNGFLVRVSQCQTLNKPLFVGEAGIIPNEVGGTLQARADAFAAKLAAQFDEGIVGYLAWAYTGGPSTLNDYDIGAGDPTLDVLVVP